MITEGMTFIETPLRRIACHYGIKQIRQLIEETNELALACCKYDRALQAGDEDISTAEIAEEIADVVIMAEQLVYLLGIKTEVRGNMIRKIERQLKRMGGTTNEQT